MAAHWQNEEVKESKKVKYSYKFVCIFLNVCLFSVIIGVSIVPLLYIQENIGKYIIVVSLIIISLLLLFGIVANIILYKKADSNSGIYQRRNSISKNERAILTGLIVGVIILVILLCMFFMFIN